MDNQRTLIICLATSPHGAVVAKEGIRFARILDATPVFLNVGADTKDRREILAALIREAGSSEIDPSKLLIRPGNPFAIIAATATELAAEMIILGALNRDPAWVRVWGSVARKIARRAPCSVLLLSSGMLHRAGDRIVAGVGFDVKSAQAMPVILQIARQSESESLHFVREFSEHSASIDEDASGFPMSDDEQALNRQRAEQRMLADFLSAFDLSGLNVRMAALPGREGMQVVDYARRQRADLIILPAPPKPLTLWDRFFRHPLETVLMELPCALLLHRPSRNNQRVATIATDPRTIRQEK